MKTKSINTTSAHANLPLLKGHQRIINNVTIELTKGKIESEGAKVSERTGIIKLYTVVTCQSTFKWFYHYRHIAISN